MGCISSSPSKDTTKAPRRIRALAGGLEDVVFDAHMQSKHNSSSLCEEAYALGRVLGKGGFATVRLGTQTETGKKFAVKIMKVVPKGEEVAGNDNTWKDVVAEVSVLCRLNHPNVIELSEFFIQNNTVYLVTSLVQGGELLEAMLARGSYSESVARQCFKQLLQGVAYCHALGVVHRDIKLENLLLERPNDITQLRIVDFGLAKGHYGGSALEMTTICGTPYYVAPEILSVSSKPGERYGAAVDLWSCGVVLFILLSGNPPFYHMDVNHLYRLIRKGSYAFQDPVWDMISDSAKDLITRLLVVDPELRLCAADALQHPWMKQADAGDANLAGTLENMKDLGGRMLAAVRPGVASSGPEAYTITQAMPEP